MAKGGTIKGIILEIGADTSGLQKALSKVNSNASSLSKELRGVNSLLKLDPKNVELLDQKQTILNESIETTQDKLNQLKKIKEEADKKMSEGTKISEENYRNLQREIINTQNKLNGLTDELKQFNAQNSNWTKAGKKIQEYGNNITKASEKIDEIGNKTSVVSAGVVAGGTALVNSAMNLEDAVAKYVSSTNTAEEETQKYKQVLENINNNNYGEGYEDIANSMTQVKMQLKNINEQDLQNITEKAIALRDLFGYDVSESVRAVKAMMDNLNVSADEAFNLIAEGKKQGLDFSNELLDNVNEYSVQFGKLGLSAQDMFNIFKVGADNGAFNLDKIGDAVKEFSIRAIDGSNTTIDGFKRIGLNADDMAKKFAGGGEAAKQAFIEVVNRLGSMDDKVSQSIAGVDLFGTMWEDLGPTVVTSFSKMDNGISQSSDSMQKSIDQLYNTTKKKAETQLKRLQSLGADFGEEMLPVLEDLIDIAEKFIDKLDGMSDAEKENIVKIGLLVAGAGPLIKTMGTVGKVIGNVTNGIGIFSQAIGIAKTGATSANQTVNSLANGITFLTNPVGLATVAVGALAAALIYLNAKQSEENQKVKEFAEDMKKYRETYEEYNKSIDKTTNANLAQIDSVKRLKDELFTLVDENGKVKAGYESRVDFILNELNGALDTEYKLNGNIIQSYKDLQNEIDGTIEKKKAEIILKSKEEKYTNAINTETEAVDKLKEAREKLGMTYEDAKKKVEDYFKAVEEGTISADEALSQNKDIENLKKYITAYEDAEKVVKQCVEDRKSYENDYALFVEGKYNEIGQTITNTTKNWINASIKEIQSGMIAEQQSLNKYKELYETTGSEVALQQKEQAEQNLRTLADELIARTTTIEQLGPQEILAWKTLANNSYDVYKESISKMSPEMQAEIQRITGILINNTSVQTEAGALADRVVSSMDRKKQAISTGQNIVKGLQEGIQDKYLNTELMKSSATLADNMIKKMNLSAGVQSPSKYARKTGRYVDEGLILGIKDKEKEVLNTASKLSNNLIDQINKNKMLNFSKLEGLNSKLNTKILSSTKTMYTTPQITFNVQELDEARLQQCFNYINKKFGSQY